MGPTVTVDLDVIERNARTVTAECASRGMNVFGVTKGTCGTPAVARAMLRGGVVGIGESRFENVARLAPAQGALWVTSTVCPSGEFPALTTALSC